MENDHSLSDEITSAANKAADGSASSTERPQSTPETADASTRVTPERTEPEITRIPLSDHERILDGYHKRLDSLSWASGLDADDVREALAIRRQLAQREKQSTEPQPDVKDERGDLFYSPQQAAKWADWKAGQREATLRDEFEQRLGPMEATFTEQQKVHSLTQQIDQAKTWPGFTDHVDAVTKALADANARGQKLTLHEAYITVVAPILAGSSAASDAEKKKKWLAELNHTSDVVKDDLHPGKRPASTRKDRSAMSIKELTADVFREKSTA